MKHNNLREIILLFILSATAADVFAQTPIGTIPCTITADGSYYIPNDLTYSTANSTMITVNAGVKATIDLNGHKLTSSNETVKVIDNFGNLTVLDSSEGHNGIIEGSSKSRRYNGGAIINNSGAELLINGGTIQNFYSYGNSGGAILNSEGADLEINGENVVFMNCKKNNGSTDGTGGGAVMNKGSMELIKGTFSSCSSTRDGGAIYNNGNLTISGGTISSCTSNYYGGAVFNNGNLTITGGTVASCTSSRSGGAIYNSATGKLVLNGENAVIDGCKQTYSSGGGGAIYNGGVFTFKNGEIQNCTSSWQGGAIYNTDSLSVEGGKIIGCSSTNNGGGIFNNSSKCSISDGSIYGCDSGNYGGGVFTSYNCFIKINDCHIENCTASNRGGGIYSDYASTTILNGGTIKKCVSKATTESGSNQRGGGGICIFGNSSTIANTLFTMGAPTLVDGCSALRGAGLLLDYCTAVINGGTISNNSSNYEGGGLYSGFGSLTLNNVLVTKNTALAGGAGVSSGNGAVLYMYDGTVISYNETTDADNYDDYGGGGILIGKVSSKSTFFMYGGTVINNKCNYNGGGVYIRTGDSGNYITIMGGTIANNEAVADGGGVYTRGECIVEKCDILKNTAGGYGGGVYLGGRYGFTMTGGLIKNNESTKGGGGVYSSTTATLSGGTIENNKSTSGNGGGVYIASGELTISNFDLNTNEAIYGGGFYVDNGTNYINSGVTIHNNIATQNGGAIYTNGGTTTFSGGIIINNTAESDGAALYGKSGTVTLSGTTFKKNEAKGNGGAIFNSGATLSFTGSQIFENTAVLNGGGVYSSSGIIKIYRGYIEMNEAKLNGGGIYSKGGTITFDKQSGSDEYGHISNNTAMNGGGIYIESAGVINFNYGVIMGNHAKSSGTSIKTAYHSDSSLAEAEISGVGGGVYVGKSTSSSYTQMNFNSTESSLGLFKNTADNAADDLFADGLKTQVKLPVAKNMLLFGVAGRAKGWYADYVTDDTKYLQDGLFTEGSGKRYRPDQLTPEYEITSFKTIQNKYICFTLAIQPTLIILQKTGLKTGESAYFTLTNDTYKRHAVLTGIDDEGSMVSVSLAYMETGTWTISEDTKWSWTYNTVKASQNVVIDGSEDKTVTFTNTKKDDVPSNSEKIKVNIF